MTDTIKMVKPVVKSYEGEFYYKDSGKLLYNLDKLWLIFNNVTDKWQIFTSEVRNLTLINLQIGDDNLQNAKITHLTDSYVLKLLNDYFSQQGSEFDDIKKPSHYADGKIECWDAMQSALTPEEFIGYLKGCIFKYNWRMGKKKNNPMLKDVEKLIKYAGKLKETVEKKYD